MLIKTVLGKMYLFIHTVLPSTVPATLAWLRCVDRVLEVVLFWFIVIGGMLLMALDCCESLM